MHTAPKHLGPMEKNDYLLDQCIDGETVWVAARRLDHLLKPKQDRDDDIEAHLLEVQEAKERGIQHIMNDLDPDEKKLSFEQTKQYKQMFKAIDVSGDGKIDGDELAEYINGSSGSVQTSSKQIASMMRLYDKDNDGEIDRDEFLEMMAQLQVVDNALASMSTVFYDFDIDGDGNITRDEFKQVMRAYPR
jgi:Ca2+-binding EF-hand superfamily protein